MKKGEVCLSVAYSRIGYGSLKSEARLTTQAGTRVSFYLILHPFQTLLLLLSSFSSSSVRDFVSLYSSTVEKPMHD